MGKRGKLAKRGKNRGGWGGGGEEIIQLNFIALFLRKKAKGSMPTIFRYIFSYPESTYYIILESMYIGYKSE